MPNPYAPRTTRATAPSFPEGRMRRIGADDDEVQVMRADWDAMTGDEQTQAAEAIAALTDDELAADLADQRETATLDGLHTWAEAAVAAGEYPDTNGALDALDAVADLTDDERAALTTEVAQGGPGEAGEAPPNGSTEGGADPTGDGSVVADARARIADGTPPSKMLRWIGTDRTRAAAVLVAEGERETPRVQLISGAQAVLDG